jgi:antirestriction protein ArdC
MKPKLDIHQSITDSIIAAIEAGAGDVHMPWHRTGMSSLLPTNASTGNVYQGINVISLWCVSEVRNYPHSLWSSYRQWQALGAQVRGGEKSATVVFYKQFDVEPNPEDAEDDGQRRVARASRVFNVAQVDGFALEELPAMPLMERHARADAFIAATKADIRHGGEQAFYRPSTDHIQMPDEWRFREADPTIRSESYFSVLLHEATHWTSTPQRCDRQLGKRFGDDQYAAEELVAELGSAFLCAVLGISPQPRPDHASYIGHWLRIMKGDNKAIFSAAARAAEASRYLQSLQPKE